ncbi:AarF/UbiB family protein [Endozoicomonas sp. SCSIO W0465]|uniref:AarF/UbiB family protein n=1 Tax=Endozoicomonas sp. SCSIO W0465 TaxID=2918516 RepID=UPI002075FE16|nr:AarF/UbiB family protein [Endozoicomonas sp. SCSIO W0465]USE39276.1 AarF/UbiB family protein [Endozoicomonas sp. SCSIO W0465]
MTKAELIHCLDEAGIDYDPDRLDERVNLGTGSIGEVNEIILKGGGHLIVKTVSSSSETRVYSDLRVLRFMLGLITFFSPSVMEKGTKHAFCSFFDSIKEEVNLITEANRTRQQAYAIKAIEQQHIYNIRQSDLPECAFELPSRPDGWPIRHPDTGRLLRKLPVNYKVPAVYGDTASPHALGMEKIEGATLSENDQPELRGIAAKLFNIDPEKLTDDHLSAFRFSLKRLAFEYWSYCYAQTGFFNADMHDGNVMVAVEDGQLSIYFIDLGNAQKVSRNTVMATYTVLGAMEKLRQESDEAVRSQYADQIVRCLHNLGDYDSDKVNWATLKHEVLKIMPYGVRGSLESKVIELFNRGYTCHVKIPKETAALFRAKILIDSQCDMTDEARRSLDNIMPSLMKLLDSDDSSAEPGFPMVSDEDQKYWLMMLQQYPELQDSLLEFLRTWSITEDEVRHAVFQLISKRLPPEEFRKEVDKLMAQWRVSRANPGIQ